MELIKKVTGTIKANPMGGVLGAGAGFLAARKFMPGNKYAMAGGILVGFLLGAYVSSAVKSKGTPTKTDVTTK